MKSNLLRSCTGLVALAALLWLPSASAISTTDSKGDSKGDSKPDAKSDASAGPAVEYAFHDAPVNSMGIKSLTELRGKPIVIDFWGRN